MGSEELPTPRVRFRAGFEPTDWATVIAAGQDDSLASRSALARLCQIYWYPLYAHVRRRGYDAEDAQDLTQGFFAYLLSTDGLKTVAPAKGHFRSFLLAAINNHLAGQWHRRSAQKRGGQATVISWDALEADERYAREPADNASPDVLFERQWAKTLVDHVIERLRGEYSRNRQGDTFVILEPFLTQDAGNGEYRPVASQLGITEGAVRTAVHRLRSRLGVLICAELAQTVPDRNEVREEIRSILNALAGR